MNILPRKGIFFQVSNLAYKEVLIMNTIEDIRLMHINNGLIGSYRRFNKCLKDEDTVSTMVVSNALSELLMWICISDEWHLQNNKDGKYRKSRHTTPGGRYVNWI